MSIIGSRHNMPPGLKSQIVIAVVLTLCALFVLPTALSAAPPIKNKSPYPGNFASAGQVKTTVRAFSSADFAATAFSDWDKSNRQ